MQWEEGAAGVMGGILAGVENRNDGGIGAKTLSKNGDITQKKSGLCYR